MNTSHLSQNFTRGNFWRGGNDVICTDIKSFAILIIGVYSNSKRFNISRPKLLFKTSPFMTCTNPSLHLLSPSFPL